MTVIPFPSKPTFQCLSAGSDGFYVLCVDERGAPLDAAIGPFQTAEAARDWAVEVGAREGVLIDWSTFPDSERGLP